MEVARDMDLGIETTADIEIPNDPLQRVIGQEKAVELAGRAVRQHRHLLLVGPPGIGKSMIAQAISLYLPEPSEEIHVVHNPENPERPFVKVKTRIDIINELEHKQTAEGVLLDPQDVPPRIAEELGYRCRNCGVYSTPDENPCPSCGKPKFYLKGNIGPFSDLFGLVEITLNQFAPQMNIHKKRVRDTIYNTREGREEVVAYEAAGEKIRLLNEKALEKEREIQRQNPSKVIVPLNRRPFVMATGASETELLGDVRHDPYGGHPKLGTLPYERVVAGAIHEAHQGVLFIDELPHLGHLQRYILTAMQEKVFPITGRNPQSAGASVRVDAVPCDLIFVGACNIQDIPHILSPLRSRIAGNGYEILLETTMPYNIDNCRKYAQFVAQEIQMDGRIPHATAKAVIEIIKEGKKRARVIDNKRNALTLRLRDLGGLIRAAGDLAIREESEYIEAEHVRKALNLAKSIEEQIKERYGSIREALKYDISSSQREIFGYDYWNISKEDHIHGYE